MYPCVATPSVLGRNVDLTAERVQQRIARSLSGMDTRPGTDAVQNSHPRELQRFLLSVYDVYVFPTILPWEILVQFELHEAWCHSMTFQKWKRRRDLIAVARGTVPGATVESGFVQMDIRLGYDWLWICPWFEFSVPTCRFSLRFFCWAVEDCRSGKKPYTIRLQNCVDGFVAVQSDPLSKSFKIGRHETVTML